jgi:hypothetical protein
VGQALGEESESVTKGTGNGLVEVTGAAAEGMLLFKGVKTGASSAIMAPYRECQIACSFDSSNSCNRFFLSSAQCARHLRTNFWILNTFRMTRSIVAASIVCHAAASWDAIALLSHASSGRTNGSMALARSP